MNIPKINTLGELKKAGYRNKSVKEEIRANLIRKLKNKETTFPGILGYEDSVIPDTERALLSRHNILFLGLRGQAKTRMAREMVNLLDEWIPVVAGSEINEDPFAPISLYAMETIETGFVAIPVSVKTFLAAVIVLFIISRIKSPQRPALAQRSYASRTCVIISRSPTSIESSEEAT